MIKEVKKKYHIINGTLHPVFNIPVCNNLYAIYGGLPSNIGYISEYYITKSVLELPIEMVETYLNKDYGKPVLLIIPTKSVYTYKHLIKENLINIPKDMVILAFDGVVFYDVYNGDKLC